MSFSNENINRVLFGGHQSRARRRESRQKKERPKESHWDAHVTSAHVTARTESEALKKARATVRVRRS